MTVDITAPDITLSQQMVALTDCLRPRIQGGGGDIYGAARAFFSNVYNMPGTREALSRYGVPNCGSPWQPIFTVYKAAQYFNEFSLPAEDPSNCTTIKTMINSVANEQANLHQRFLEGAGNAEWYKYSAIGLDDRATDVNAMYARLNCDANINSQVQSTDIATLQSVTASLQPVGAPPSALTLGNISPTLMVGALVAVLLIIVIIWPTGKK
jgi:hypothetical protein